MKRRIFVFLLAICVSLVGMLGGCAKQKEPTPIGSEYFETPALEYGVMEYEKFSVLPWNSGRCEATSGNTMAETEVGFYISFSSSFLHYADKMDLTNWVKVCNQPNCGHVNESCNAWIYYSTFVVYDNRIYYNAFGPSFPQFCSQDDLKYVLLSMDPDGTGKQLEFSFENPKGDLVGLMAMATSDYWLYSCLTVDPQGNYRRYFFIAEDGKKHIITEDYGAEQPQGDPVLSNPGQAAFLYGDAIIVNGIPEVFDQATKYYRLEGDTLTQLNISGSNNWGAYVSGNVVRQFRENEGYFDVDLTTGEEVKLAPPQMEGSKAYIVLPNCILESTLNNVENRTAEQAHRMVLFDGERWREVELPEELKCTGPEYRTFIKAVTSEMVIVRMIDHKKYSGSGIASYYGIDLTQENLKLEFIADIDEW